MSDCMIEYVMNEKVFDTVVGKRDEKSADCNRRNSGTKVPKIVHNP